MALVGGRHEQKTHEPSSALNGKSHWEKEGKKLDYQVAIWEHEFVNKAKNPEQTLTGSQLPVVFTGTLTVLSSPGGGRKSALVVMLVDVSSESAVASPAAVHGHGASFVHTEA